MPQPEAQTPGGRAERSIVEGLRKIIVEDLDVDRAPEEIDDTVPLLDEGLAFDSITLVDFIERIEKKYAVRFPESALRPENFANLAVVARLVARRLEESGGAGAAPAGT